ncbi:hypothetical protein SEA_SATIS_110 [Streptomyces phage Satis]|nr:hypothetical protein SEA_SATIS_110 [Streptomyces phage Satis]
MSWTGGTRIFDSVTGAIQDREEGDISATELIVALVKALKDEGWDPSDAGVGGLDEESPVREALREFGVVEKCSGEHPENPWQCEGEKGHYPATKHEDYQGNTWSDEEDS